MKGRGGFSIDENRKFNSRYTFDDGVDHNFREIHRFKSGSKKVPFKYAIGLIHVSFDSNIYRVTVSLAQVMENLIGNNNIISYESSSNKSTLITTNDAGNNGLESIGNGFGNDLKGNITEGYRSKVTWLRWVIGFGDEANVSIIEWFRVAIIVEDL
jgi:hypothetical protein